MINKIKLFLKEKWYIVVAFTITAILVIYCLATKKKVPQEVIDVGKAELNKKIGDLRTKEALEIGRAQGKEEAVKDEVKAISDMPQETLEDQKKQLEALANLINRTR